MSNERETWAAGESQPGGGTTGDTTANDGHSDSAAAEGVNATDNAGNGHGGQVSSNPAALAEPAPVIKERKKSAFGQGFGLGSGAAVGAGLVVLVLSIPAMIIPLVMMSIMFSDPSAGSTEGINPVLYGNADADKELRVFDVEGVILGENSGSDIFGTGTYGYELAEKIDEVEADDAEGIILEMNTPGGTIYGSVAIADAVDRYRERTNKPVFAYVRSMSASGGMWAMAGADDIVADHGTMVGSIGVIYGPFTYYEGVTSLDGGLLGQGVTADRIEESYFTAGKGKDMGNSFRPLTDEERSHIQQQVDASYDNFVAHISKSREIPQDKIRNDFGAYVFDAAEAVTNGLVDAELSEREAYDRFLEKAGTNAEDAKIVDGTEPGFWEALTLGASANGLLPFGASKQSDPLYTTGLPVDSSATVSYAGFCTMGQTALAYHGDASQHCSR